MSKELKAFLKVFTLFSLMIFSFFLVDGKAETAPRIETKNSYETLYLDEIIHDGVLYADSYNNQYYIDFKLLSESNVAIDNKIVKVKMNEYFEITDVTKGGENID